MKKQLGTLLLLSGMATGGLAQEDGQLVISGQMKNRTELANGVNTALKQENTVPGIGTGYRARITFAYTKGPVKVVIKPQAIGSFGAENQYFLFNRENTNSESFGLFEGYGQYTVGKATFKFGRQAVVYGDQRILGGLDWAMSGRSHDGLVGKFALSESTKLDVGIIYGSNISTALPAANNVDVAASTGSEGFQFLWLDQKFDKLSFSFLAMNSLTQTGSNSPSYTGIVTLGLMPKFKVSDNFTVSGSLYRQFGGAESTSSKEKSYMYNIDLAYKGDGYGITLGADMVSGDDAKTATNEQFELFHGTHHKFYGLMDFFYVGEKPATGLTDVYLKTSLKASKKLTLLAHGHYFMANKTNGVVKSGEVFGIEADLVAKYKVAKGFGLVGGISAMTDTKDLRNLRGETAGTDGNINSWSWLQANFTF